MPENVEAVLDGPFKVIVCGPNLNPCVMVAKKVFMYGSGRVRVLFEDGNEYILAHNEGLQIKRN